MINQLLAPIIDQYVREFLGDWDLARNLQISSVMVPEINLTNVPLPQFVFDLAELPLVVCSSNIGRVQAKCSWGTFLGELVHGHSLGSGIGGGSYHLRLWQLVAS